MKIRNRRLVWSREIVDAAIHEGWDAAAISGRDHLTQLIATTETMVVAKEQNGKVTLFPYKRITDLHQGVSA